MSEPSWLTVPVARPDARLRLICLPFAGGGAAAYRAWARRLPRWLEVTAAQLPGRETRIHEPARPDVHEIVPELVAALAPGLGERPYAVYGHSMGTVIGFELCRALRRAGLPQPRALVVAARRAPHLPRPAGRPLAHTLSHDAFLDLLRRYGGTPEELLRDPDALELFLPLLRADFSLVDTYEYREEPPFTFPITVYTGIGDAQVTDEGAAAWAHHTTAAFARRTFDGGHFFHMELGAKFLEALADDLAQATGVEPVRVE
jgi:medium-chain acyl-[acyl-carrier-protein] hydrolase